MPNAENMPLPGFSSADRLYRRRDKPAVIALRAGWEDARMNLPPNPEYQNAERPRCALSYELGRLHASNARGAGLPVPEWRDGCVPHAYTETRDAAIAAAGLPF